jgi:hypothetical protein
MRFLPSRIERRSPRAAVDAAVPGRPPADPEQQPVAALVALTYELLDAHADTARLAEEECGDAGWQTHLAYLRDLQRVGREALAGAVALDGEPALPR